MIRRFMGLVASTFAATAVLASPEMARAAASARLVYMRGPGAEECPGEPAVRAAVSTRLGYDPFFAWARDTLFAEVTRIDGAFRAEVKLVDDNNMQRGAREISVKGNDCAPVVDAMGLTISLTIDPSSIAGPAHIAPMPPPPVPVEPVLEGPASNPPMPPETRAIATPNRSEPWSARLGLGTVGSVGTAPAATVGATLFVGGSWRVLSLDLEARADVPATGTRDGTSAQVRSWLVIGSIVPCVHVGAAFGCAIASGGSLGATSVGIAAPRTDSAPWWAAGVRGGAEFDLARALSFRAYAELLGTLTRNTLIIDSTPAYTFAQWSGGVGVALAWRFL